MDIIKAKFLMDGKPVSREYSYYINEAVAVGDIVQAETNHGKADLIVTAVNVPETEVAPFKDKMKYCTKKAEESEG